MSILRVLTVCTGNVCRSPAAAVVLREAVRAHGLGGLIEVSSAGTSWEAEGLPMDSRTEDALERAGYARPFEHTVRSVHQSELPRWDMMLPMTAEQAQTLRRKAEQVPEGQMAPQIEMWRRFDPSVPADADEEDLAVPDPWYEEDEEFDRTVESLRLAVPALLEHLRVMLREKRGAAD